ncbi:hypothetical protein NQ315_008712 [Exocentrus adspersus]|uniref:Lipocalin/cytosolic fatty-acid binding domain-containing protein n=1 Tax=Exocentrus adspersus TaxID=1586481 RepID=A0AAV8W7E4_9CUCU|nr:hypothetical protein NQ315_008712 [Exocentrus adspersus]
MVQISGKYEPVENVNFYEFLVKMGIPEAKAKVGNERKSAFEVAVDGDKIRFISGINNKTTELVLGKEVEETLPMDIKVKSVAKLDGNVVTIESKKPEENFGGRRILTFTDSGLEMKIIVDKEGVPEAKRVYKRI